MRALLLAAGLGMRLKPLTNTIPKCLVPINGRPLLDYWLENLLGSGVVDEVLINTHYLAPIVHKYVSQTVWKERIQLVHEEQMQGTGGTILVNRLFFREEKFLVAHADNLTIFDVADFMRCHEDRPTGTDMTMMIFEADDPKSCGIVQLNEQGVVKAFHEKVESPPGNLANAAVYLLEPSVLDMMKSLGRNHIDFSTEVIPQLLGRIYTFYNTTYHRDIGTMSSWLQGNIDFQRFNSDEHHSSGMGSKKRSDYFKNTLIQTSDTKK